MGQTDPCRVLRDLWDLCYLLGTPCLPLLRDTLDLCCRLGFYCPLPAEAQGSAGPVVCSQNTLSATAQGHTGPLLSTRDALPPAGPVLSPGDSLPPVGCSGTHRNSGVISGLLANVGCSETRRTCDVFREHPGCLCSGTYIFCGVVSGHNAPCRLLRDTQDLGVFSQNTLSNTAQEASGPVLSSWNS